jgi:hypothetical protein
MKRSCGIIASAGSWTGLTRSKELWVAKMGRKPTVEEFRQHIHALWDAFCDWWDAFEKALEKDRENKVVALRPRVTEEAAP